MIAHIAIQLRSCPFYAFKQFKY